MLGIYYVLGILKYTFKISWGLPSPIGETEA